MFIPFLPLILFVLVHAASATTIDMAKIQQMIGNCPATAMATCLDTIETTQCVDSADNYVDCLKAVAAKRRATPVANASIEPTEQRQQQQTPLAQQRGGQVAIYVPPVSVEVRPKAYTFEPLECGGKCPSVVTHGLEAITFTVDGVPVEVATRTGQVTPLPVLGAGQIEMVPGVTGRVTTVWFILPETARVKYQPLVRSPGASYYTEDQTHPGRCFGAHYVGSVDAVSGSGGPC